LSADLAETSRPYFETCLEALGPKRAMFDGNFPEDKRQTVTP
jgi:predicted TIM-barrel fold metal-dependent hydrolase